MPKNFLECGEIVGVHGIAGEVKIKPWGNDAEHLLKFSRFFNKTTTQQLNVKSMRVHKNMLLVNFEGIAHREKAEELRGTVLCIAREDDSLEEGQYYWSDLIGLSVENADTGEKYGNISEISDTGANLVYHIAAKERELLIPAIPQVVKEILLDEKKMKIVPLDGLFD